MIFPVVSVLATLIVVVALNWSLFRSGGWPGVIRLALIWAVIILAALLLLRLFPGPFDRFYPF